MTLLINLCLKQTLTTSSVTSLWIPCQPKESLKAGFPTAGGCPPCTGVQCPCKPVSRGSLLSETIQESPYTAPLIHANLPLFPAAFCDERGSQESQTMIRVLCPSPLLPCTSAQNAAANTTAWHPPCKTPHCFLGMKSTTVSCLSLQNHIDGNFTSRVRLALQSGYQRTRGQNILYTTGI